MTLSIRLTHTTRYQYDRAVQLGPQLIRLRPAPHTKATIQSYALTVVPESHHLHWQQDAYANYQARVLVPDLTDRFEMQVVCVANLVPVNPFDFYLEPQAEQVPLHYLDRDGQGLAPYLNVEPSAQGFTGLFYDFFSSVVTSRQPTIEFLVGLNHRIQRECRYLVRHEPGIQSPEETLRKGCGSCRDLAWLEIQVLRRLGLAARFVSGYWIQADSPYASELHAWTEVYVPGAGWIGLDPTAGVLAGQGHIPLACAPEPSGAAPIEGSLEACGVVFNHEIQVSSWNLSDSAGASGANTE